jgi:DNA-directed RNA polymerase
VERYKGYRVPIAWLKSGTLVKQLAAREQTTSDEILNSAAQRDSVEPKEVGPHTSTEDLLEALDLALGSEEDLEEDEPQEREVTPTEAKTETEGDGDTGPAVSKRKKRRTREEMKASYPLGLGDELKFVELTKLLPTVPKKGNFEVNTVKKSLYFFS